MAPKPKFQFAFEEVEVSNDEEEEDQEKDLTENEFEDFLKSISIPKEDVAVTPLAMTKRDRNLTVQFYSSTSKQMDNLIVELQRTMRKPPQTILVTTEPPSKSDQEDSAHVLLPRRRKRRDLTPRDIRISELGKDNSIKDVKISELQENLGGLIVLFFNLKQRLHQKFGDDFQPLSAEGDKIYASSSGLVNPTSQPASERVIRPVPHANLYTFLSSGQASAQEGREKQIRVE
ncbi:unnamed protein product [Lactuca saligna]|uniref:Uncharacterized protein n=1 Tax=Lactuca saligna TaxID=75948 RepID=A0AA35ZGJ5_LACSI|nr:unnamed protein product [Lactuca saligna]